MNLEIISYAELSQPNQDKVKSALLNTGIIGIRNVPHFLETSARYIEAARAFSHLNEAIKKQYEPLRDLGDTEGYELGAESFQDADGEWRIDDKKASFYAFVPDHAKNKWPKEVDLKTPYLALGELIHQISKEVLGFLGLYEKAQIDPHHIVGYGRMLHYLKENHTNDINPNWCGGHYDHGILTGLMPAYYFQEGKAVEEPEEAGLYIMPSNSNQYVKMEAHDKSVLLFQVGEFGQLAFDDEIRATKHLVKKAKGNIERYTFALFNNPPDEAKIHSQSILTKDARYNLHQANDGSIRYHQWQKASYDRYRASHHADLS